MEIKLWMIFITVLIILIIMIHKIIKSNKKSKLFILSFIILSFFWIYSFFTINGSVRLSIALYGHPIIAYTTEFNNPKSMNDDVHNMRYILPVKHIDDMSSFFKCKYYGPIKITTYYGF